MFGKKGLALLALMTILAIIGFVVFSVSLFFTWKMWLFFIAIIGLVVALAQGKIPKQYTNIALIALVVMFGMAYLGGFFGGTIVQTSTQTPSGLEVQVNLKPNYQAGLLPTDLMAPGTYREIEVTVCNHDTLPYIIDTNNDVVLVTATYPCPTGATSRHNKTNPIVCSMNPETKWKNVPNYGFPLNLLDVTVLLGVSKLKPNEAWLNGVPASDREKYIMVTKPLGSKLYNGKIILWKPEYCRQYAENQEVCNYAVECQRIVGKAWLWVARSAPTGSYDMHTILFRYIGNNEWQVDAATVKHIEVQTPGIILLVVLGGIGLLLAVAWKFKLIKF